MVAAGARPWVAGGACWVQGERRQGEREKNEVVR